MGEGRVPTEMLKRLLAEFGDGAPGALTAPGFRWAVPGRAAGVIAGVLSQARRVARQSRQSEAETPAALRLNGAEAIEELFDAAYDCELAMLDELVERAGLGWKCRAQVAGFPCHYMNVGTSLCGGCGAGEDEGKEEPDG